MTPRELEVLQELRRWSDEFDVARAIEHHVRAILERPEAKPTDACTTKGVGHVPPTAFPVTPSTRWQHVHDVAPKGQP